MEKTGTVQGQGYLHKRGNDQVEGQEDPVNGGVSQSGVGKEEQFTLSVYVYPKHVSFFPRVVSIDFMYF